MEKNKTKIIAGTGIFTALSFLVSFLEFPIFPATSFLQIDFSAVFTLLSGFVFGPVSAIIVSLIKELLRFLINPGSSGGIGELANFIITLSYVLLPTVLYRKIKGIKVVIITLVISSVFASGVALLTNKFILFPLYGFSQFFASVWWYVLLFNLIKYFAVSLLTFIIYKRVSIFIKKI